MALRRAIPFSKRGVAPIASKFIRKLWSQLEDDFLTRENGIIAAYSIVWIDFDASPNLLEAFEPKRGKEHVRGRRRKHVPLASYKAGNWGESKRERIRI